MWTLYEVDHGMARITYKPKELLPVKEYLSIQGRFRGMNEQDMETLQRWICNKWTRDYGEEAKVAVCKAGEKHEFIDDGDPIHGV